MLQPALQAYPLWAITKTAEVFSSHNRAGKRVDLDNHKRWMTRCLEAFGFLPWLFIFVWCIAFSDPGRVGLTKQRPQIVREKESNPWKPPQNLPDYPSCTWRFVTCVRLTLLGLWPFSLLGLGHKLPGQTGSHVHDMRQGVHFSQLIPHTQLNNDASGLSGILHIFVWLWWASFNCICRQNCPQNHLWWVSFCGICSIVTYIPLMAKSFIFAVDTLKLFELYPDRVGGVLGWCNFVTCETAPS